MREFFVSLGKLLLVFVSLTGGRLFYHQNYPDFLSCFIACPLLSVASDVKLVPSTRADIVSVNNLEMEWGLVVMVLKIGVLFSFVCGNRSTVHMNGQ